MLQNLKKTVSPQNLILGMPPMFGHVQQIRENKTHVAKFEGLYPVATATNISDSRYAEYKLFIWRCINNSCIKGLSFLYHPRYLNSIACPRCKATYHFVDIEEAPAGAGMYHQLKEEVRA